MESIENENKYKKMWNIDKSGLALFNGISEYEGFDEILLYDNSITIIVFNTNALEKGFIFTINKWIKKFDKEISQIVYDNEQMLVYIENIYDEVD